MITKLSQIVDEARQRGARRLAVACAADAHTLEAVAAAAAEGIVSPILYGNSDTIIDICNREGIDASGWEIINEKTIVPPFVWLWQPYLPGRPMF